MCNDLIYNIGTKVMESTWIQGIFVFSLTIYFVAQFILQMKQVVLTLFFLLSVFHCSAQEKLLSLDGTFQNNNLVVYNPPQSDGFGFCVTKVLVNGEILPAAIQSAHFEINFQLLITPHSGKNQIRVSQIDNTGEKRSSQTVFFNSGLSSLKITPTKVRDNLHFKVGSKEAKTKFEVYDAYGNLLKVGFASMVDCTNLVSGVYFINFDNQTEKFIKIAE